MSGGSDLVCLAMATRAGDCTTWKHSWVVARNEPCAPRTSFTASGRATNSASWVLRQTVGLSLTLVIVRCRCPFSSQAPFAADMCLRLRNKIEKIDLPGLVLLATKVLSKGGMAGGRFLHRVRSVAGVGVRRFSRPHRTSSS